MDDLIWSVINYLAMNDLFKQRLSTLLRETRGLRSQRQFARDLGVSLGSVQNWENADSLPTLEAFEIIATAAGMSMMQLLAYLIGEDITSLPKPKVAEDVLPHALHLEKKQMVRLIKLLLDEIAKELE